MNLNIRHFIAKAILCFFAVILIQSCKNASQLKDEQQRPNVLFISVDDLNDWIEPLGGSEFAKTPHLNALSESSFNFKHAYCASPGCGPSRAAIMTGLHTYTTGMYSNYQDWRDIDGLKERTLNGIFKSNGYYTAGAGKIYHYTQTDTAGWVDYFPSKTKPMPDDDLPEIRPLNMPDYQYKYKMFDWGPLSISDKETSDYKSVNYISNQFKEVHEKPFFLACGIYRPHVPWYVPQKYFDMFPLEDIELPKIKANDLEDLDDFAKHELIERGGNYHKHVVEAEQWKKGVQGYLASIAFADAMVGELLANLAKSRYADNTIVVLWSDHGWQLGEKSHWRKFALWENVNRSVLMIQLPKKLRKKESFLGSGAIDNPVSLLDIYPTLIELCDLPKMDKYDGKSLVPYFKGSNELADRPIITTYDYGSYSIRYKHWHFIKYVDESEELYDLSKDPEEWANIAKAQSHKSEIEMLRGFIPKSPVDLPLESLLELQEHHVPPIQSRAHYESEERRNWMKRFESI